MFFEHNYLESQNNLNQEVLMLILKISNNKVSVINQNQIEIQVRVTFGANNLSIFYDDKYLKFSKNE